jgi:hypothetical protein
MAKVPQRKMKMMRRTTRVPIVRGFGPLNSKPSEVLSGITVLLYLISDFGLWIPEFYSTIPACGRQAQSALRNGLGSQ